MHIHCPLIPILPARALNDFLQSSFPKIISKLTLSLYLHHPVVDGSAWSQPHIPRNWIVNFFHSAWVGNHIHWTRVSLPRNLKRQNSLHDWVCKPAYQWPMQETVIQNACFFPPWAKILIIFRKRKEMQLEELPGQYKDCQGLCGKKPGKAKTKWKGGGQTDTTQYFGEHSLEEKASEFSNYPKAKGCSRITLHKIWFVAWKDSTSEHKPVLSPGVVLTDTKLFSFLYICTAWFYLLCS